MAKHLLTVEPRTVLGKKVKDFRKNGKLPAILYGGNKEMTALPVLIGEKEFMRIYREAGESSIVTLEFAPGDVRNVLVHDVTRDPMTERFLHIDFYEVRMDKKLHATVPLKLVGESPAVKNEGGVLVYPLQEVEVECLPADLPHEILVDISVLARFHDAIRIKDLALPKGVVVSGNDMDETVILVEQPRSEAEIAGLSAEVDETAVKEIKTESELTKAKKEEDMKTAEEPKK